MILRCWHLSVWRSKWLLWMKSLWLPRHGVKPLRYCLLPASVRLLMAILGISSSATPSLVLCLALFFIVTIVHFVAVQDLLVVHIGRITALAARPKYKAGIDQLGFVLDVPYLKVDILQEKYSVLLLEGGE